MPETATGIVYPDSAAHTRLWEHFQALAESVDPLIAALPIIQSGKASVPFENNGLGSITITFPTPYTSTPNVVASVSTVQRAYYAQAASISATGFSLRCCQQDNLAVTTSIECNWIAVGN